MRRNRRVFLQNTLALAAAQAVFRRGSSASPGRADRLETETISPHHDRRGMDYSGNRSCKWGRRRRRYYYALSQGH